MKSRSSIINTGARGKLVILLIVAATLLTPIPLAAQTDPLPSWNDDADQASNRRVRASNNGPIEPEVCAATGTHSPPSIRMGSYGSSILCIRSWSIAWTGCPHW